jgi:DNA gyrase subunit B
VPKINTTSHGIKHTALINKDLFLSPDYRKISEFGNRLNHLLKTGAYIQRDEKKYPIETFAQGMDWLIAEAKKGQSIQRYKGLGEMNPEQLWETTMDPQKRVLLQVKVEDAVAADQIFTTLMGDEVEPRRQFIESNALEVVNLDV